MQVLMLILNLPCTLSFPSEPPGCPLQPLPCSNCIAQLFGGSERPTFVLPVVFIPIPRISDCNGRRAPSDLASRIASTAAVALRLTTTRPAQLLSRQTMPPDPKANSRSRKEGRRETNELQARRRPRPQQLQPTSPNLRDLSTRLRPRMLKRSRRRVQALRSSSRSSPLFRDLNRATEPSAAASSSLSSSPTKGPPRAPTQPMPPSQPPLTETRA